MDLNEFLFWKVYQNKFIRNLIFKFICETRIEFNKLSSYYVGNRQKFKNIRSLKLMIQRKQFSLLNYKIKCNEYISASQVSIIFLFQFIYDSKEKGDIELSSQAQQSLELLLSSPFNYIETLESINLVETAIKFGNLNFLKLYFKLPHIIKLISSFTLSYTISCCTSVEILEYMLEFLKLNQQQDIINSVLHNSIKIASSNECIKPSADKLIEFILDNKLYNPPNKNNNIKEKIELRSFLNNIKSIELATKLLEMNLVFKSDDNLSEIFETLIKTLKNKSIQELEYYLLLINNTTCSVIGPTKNNNDDDHIKYEKELKKLIIQSSNSFDKNELYLEYLVCYDEILTMENFQSDHLIYQYTFSMFSVEGLKYLMSKSVARQTQLSPKWSSTNNYKYQDLLVKYKNEILQNHGGESRIIEFIKLYYKQREQYPTGKNTGGLEFSHWVNIGGFILKECSTTVIDILLDIKQFPLMEGLVNVDFEVGEIKPFSKYQWYMENVIFQIYGGREVDFRGFNNYMSPMQKKSDIDYVFQTRNPSIKVVKFFLPIEYSDECVELANYFSACFEHRLALDYIYNLVFSNSLLQFNKKNIIQVDEYINGKVKINVSISSIMDDKKMWKEYFTDLKQISSKQDIQHIQSFFKYLFDSKYKSFHPNTWYHFMFIVFNKLIVSNNLGGSLNELLSTLEIDFNYFKHESIILLIGLIYQSKFDLALIVLSGLDSIELSDDFLFDDFIINNKFTPSYIIFEIIDYLPINYVSNNKFKDILNLIQILFGKVVDSSVKVFEPLFKHLFKLVIQCNDIDFTKIQMVLQLYQDQNIQNIELNGIYEIYNFLYIKSFKIQGYIFTRVGTISKILEYNNVSAYDCNSILAHFNPDSRYFDIKSFLPMDIFTFDYIVNSSVNQLLCEMSERFSKFSDNGIKDIKTDEDDLYYFSDIGEVSLAVQSFRRLIANNSIELDYTYIPNLNIFRSTDQLISFLLEFPQITNDMLFKAAIDSSDIYLIDWVFKNYSPTSNSCNVPFNFDEYHGTINLIFKSNFLDVASYLLENVKDLLQLPQIKYLFTYSFNSCYVDNFKLLLKHYKPDLILDPTEFKSSPLEYNQIKMVKYYLSISDNIQNKEKLLKSIY